MNDTQRTINVKISRFDPKKDKNPTMVDYQVPLREGMSVMNVLNYIYENHDSALAYDMSCRIGLCSACMMRINGKNCMACNTVVKGNITVEPTPGQSVIKDLVVETKDRKA